MFWILLFITGVIAGSAVAILIARGSPRKRTVASLLGTAFLAACLILNTELVYVAVDRAFGGLNYMYLGVQVTWLLAMGWFYIAIVPSVQLRLITHLAVTAAAIAFTCGFFFAGPQHETTYRLLSYRNEPNVLAFTMVVNIYSAYCAIYVVRALHRAVRATYAGPRKVGLLILQIGFAVGLGTFCERLLIALFGEAENPLAVAADGLLVVITTTGIAAGALTLVLTYRRTVNMPSALAGFRHLRESND